MYHQYDHQMADDLSDAIDQLRDVAWRRRTNLFKQLDRLIDGLNAIRTELDGAICEQARRQRRLAAPRKPRLEVVGTI